MTWVMNTGTFGTLGQGDYWPYMYPIDDPISFNSDFQPIRIAMGYYHNCALSVDGRVACWGYGSYLNVAFVFSYFWW